MNNETTKKLAIAGAEYLGLKSCGLRADGVEEFENDRGGSQPFDLSDHNCLKLVIEHFKIDVDYDDKTDEWRAYKWGKKILRARDKSRDKAILKCVAKCLNLEYEDE